MRHGVNLLKQQSTYAGYSDDSSASSNQHFFPKRQCYSASHQIFIPEVRVHTALARLSVEIPPIPFLVREEIVGNLHGHRDPRCLYCISFRELTKGTLQEGCRRNENHKPRIIFFCNCIYFPRQHERLRYKIFSLTRGQIPH